MWYQARIIPGKSFLIHDILISSVQWMSYLELFRNRLYTWKISIAWGHSKQSGSRTCQVLASCTQSTIHLHSVWPTHQTHTLLPGEATTSSYILKSPSIKQFMESRIVWLVIKSMGRRPWIEHWSICVDRRTADWSHTNTVVFNGSILLFHVQADYRSDLGTYMLSIASVEVGVNCLSQAWWTGEQQGSLPHWSAECVHCICGMEDRLPTKRLQTVPCHTWASSISGWHTVCSSDPLVSFTCQDRHYQIFILNTELIFRFYFGCTVFVDLLFEVTYYSRN